MPDQGIRIRPATRQDDGELAALDRRTWSPVHAVTPSPPMGKRFFDDRHRPEDVLVAEVDGRLAGYVRVVPPTPLPGNAHVRQIQGLAVDHWARGRGAGRALVEAARDHARRCGARRLTLRVLGHNTAARRLYASVGFVPEGLLPEEFEVAGEYVDDVLMGMRLVP